MRAVCALAVLVATFSGGSASAQAPTSRLPCREIADPVGRLQCYEQDGSFDFGSVLLRELECDREPRAADLLRLLIRRNKVSSLAFHVSDGINYFALPRPEKIGTLTAVAIFAHDESGRFPFLRTRGTSPGAVFGFVTRDGLGDVDAWRLTNSPALLVDDSASSMRGARDIGCFWLGRTAARASSGTPPTSPPFSVPAGEDDLFEAGLLPKRR